MLYSVAFTEKNGRKYYKKHRAKYYLEEESTVLDSIPEDNLERMGFYYYKDGVWTFDEQYYIEYQKEIEEQENGNVQENNSITQEEMIAAMIELAQNQSDLEDALVEVAALVGGE